MVLIRLSAVKSIQLLSVVLILLVFLVCAPVFVSGKCGFRQKSAHQLSNCQLHYTRSYTAISV